MVVWGTVVVGCGVVVVEEGTVYEDGSGAHLKVKICNSNNSLDLKLV